MRRSRVIATIVLSSQGIVVTPVAVASTGESWNLGCGYYGILGDRVPELRYELPSHFPAPLPKGEGSF
jgi:hypothetical protein